MTATSDDIPQLVDLMAEFYAEAGYPLNREHAASAFDSLLADERLGRIWIIQSNLAAAGYVVLTVRFAMEYGGLIACVDDLFVRPRFRNAGLASAALAEVRTFCYTIGLRALTVESARDNGSAQTVYRRTGFVPNDRQLMALELAPPTHLVR
jgi:GNAT superfamily N-acetyltransferase